MTKEEKIIRIKIAIKNGISKIKLDPKGHGNALRRLEKNFPITAEKLEEIFINLQKLETKGKKEIKQEKFILEQNKEIKILKEIICKLENNLKAAKDEKTLIKRKPKKVLGLTIIIKTNKTRKYKYIRYYALYKDKEKNKYSHIYIGKDINKAEEKIKAWYKRNKKCNV